MDSVKFLCVVTLGFAVCYAAPYKQEAEVYMVTGSTMGMDHTHDHDHTDGHTHGPDDGHSMDMKMYFHISAHATILFEGWHTMTYGELFASAAAILIFGILYEGFKAMRQSLLHSSMQQDRNRVSAKSNGTKTYQSTGDMGGNMAGSTAMMVEEPRNGATEQSTCSAMTSALTDLPHILQSCLHILQLFFSYCLMLIFMTYNVYLCLALVIGGGIGYWLFAWKRLSVSDQNEHCN